MKKGRHLSEETKEKIRQSKLGRKLSEEHKEKIRQGNLGKTGVSPMLGKHHSKETKQKISKAHLDKRLGPHSEETKEKISAANLGHVGLVGEKHPFYGKKRPEMTAEKNPMWKGDKVKYVGLHHWVKDHLQKPELCERCNSVPSRDLANITGIYSRDFLNWQYMCVKCHLEFDGRAFGQFIDMSQRKCSICSGQTDNDNKGRPHWRHIDGKLACRRCYRRVIDGVKSTRGPYKERDLTINN